MTIAAHDGKAKDDPQHLIENRLKSLADIEEIAETVDVVTFFNLSDDHWRNYKSLM